MVARSSSGAAAQPFATEVAPTIDLTEPIRERTMTDPIRLTQYSHGAGCGCKISPQGLEVILAGSGAQNLDP